MSENTHLVGLLSGTTGPTEEGRHAACRPARRQCSTAPSLEQAPGARPLRLQLRAGVGVPSTETLVGRMSQPHHRHCNPVSRLRASGPVPPPPTRPWGQEASQETREGRGAYTDSAGQARLASGHGGLLRTTVEAWASRPLKTPDRQRHLFPDVRRGKQEGEKTRWALAFRPNKPLAAPFLWLQTEPQRQAVHLAHSHTQAPVPPAASPQQHPPPPHAAAPRLGPTWPLASHPLPRGWEGR